MDTHIHKHTHTYTPIHTYIHIHTYTCFCCLRCRRCLPSDVYCIYILPLARLAHRHGTHIHMQADNTQQYMSYDITYTDKHTINRFVKHGRLYLDVGKRLCFVMAFHLIFVHIVYLTMNIAHKCVLYTEKRGAPEPEPDKQDSCFSS